MNNLHHYLYKTALVWKLAVASGLSWEISKLAGSSHPYLAPLSVILCLQVTVGKSVSYGLIRVLGTLAGVIVTSYLTPYIKIDAWSLGILIFIASAIIYWMGFSKMVINQVAMSILLVLSFESHPDYGFDRVRDTLIGCMLAIFFNMLIFPPDFTEKATQEIKTYSEKLAHLFKDTGKWMQKDFTTQHGQTLLKKVDDLFNEFAKTINQFNNAEESLRYHPFTRKSHNHLKEEQRKLKVINHGLAHLVSIIETLLEWVNFEQITQEELLFWGQRMTVIGDTYTIWVEINLDLSSPVINKKIEKSLKEWSTSFILPQIEKTPRFSYALGNDTLNALLAFKKKH